MIVLEAMKTSNNTQEIILFDFNGMPAIADADDPDNVVCFETFDPDRENDDGDKIH